jgi:hypothetical protein
VDRLPYTRVHDDGPAVWAESRIPTFRGKDVLLAQSSMHGLFLALMESRSRLFTVFRRSIPA